MYKIIQNSLLAPAHPGHQGKSPITVHIVLTAYTKTLSVDLGWARNHDDKTSSLACRSPKPSSSARRLALWTAAALRRRHWASACQSSPVTLRATTCNASTSSAVAVTGRRASTDDGSTRDAVDAENTKPNDDDTCRKFIIIILIINEIVQSAYYSKNTQAL